MEYLSNNKCTFICDTHVIFDIYIVRSRGDNNKVCDGNAIFDRELNVRKYYMISTNPQVDNQEKVKEEFEKNIERLKKDAKWIFDGIENSKRMKIMN